MFSGWSYLETYEGFQKAGSDTAFLKQNGNGCFKVPTGVQHTTLKRQATTICQ
jgi:hypothetical protein